MSCHLGETGRVFAILIQTILHLVPSPPPPPPKKKNYMTIVFDSSWDDCNIQEKLKPMVMQNVFDGKGWRGQDASWPM